MKKFMKAEIEELNIAETAKNHNGRPNGNGNYENNGVNGNNGNKHNKHDNNDDVNPLS